MPFGQSVAIRFGAKAIAAALGADPLTQAAVSRSAGWVVAHLTLDHHSQALAEYIDSTHDVYNVVEERFGDSGSCPRDTCHQFVDNIINQSGVQGHDNLCDRPICEHPKSIHD